MKCPHCHKIINRGVTFCPYCGTKISKNFIYKSKHKINSYQSNNPHKITKRAKELLAGLFAVIVIGGAAAHHLHYIHSPQSVNLTKDLNEHVVTSSSMDGHKKALNSIIVTSDLGGSDSQVGSTSKIAFDNGSLKPYNNSNSHDNSDETNPIGYTVSKDTLTIVNNGVSVSDANSDTNNPTSDANNYVKFKLDHVSDNGHSLAFKPYDLSFRSDDDGAPHMVPKISRTSPKLEFHLKVGKKLD